MIIETIIVIVVGFVGGYILSVRYAEHANGLQSLFQLMVASMWVLAAAITVWTGFYFAGASMLVIFSYFWWSNLQTVRDSDLRRKTSSWDPFGYENQR